MKFKGKFSDASVEFSSGLLSVTFQLQNKESSLPLVNELAQRKDDVLTIEVKKDRKKRSLDANAMLWACIGQIAECLRCDNEEVYLNLLESYGQYTYMEIREDAYPKFREMWRTCKEVGTRVVDGIKYVDLLCCFGSSTYNSQEFSILLDGCISEMKRLNLQIPATKDLERSLSLWKG